MDFSEFEPVSKGKARGISKIKSESNETIFAMEEKTTVKFWRVSLLKILKFFVYMRAL